MHEIYVSCSTQEPMRKNSDGGKAMGERRVNVKLVFCDST